MKSKKNKPLPSFIPRITLPPLPSMIPSVVPIKPKTKVKFEVMTSSYKFGPKRKVWIIHGRIL